MRAGIRQIGRCKRAPLPVALVESSSKCDVASDGVKMLPNGTQWVKSLLEQVTLLDVLFCRRGAGCAQSAALIAPASSLAKQAGMAACRPGAAQRLMAILQLRAEQVSCSARLLAHLHLQSRESLSELSGCPAGGGDRQERGVEAKSSQGRQCRHAASTLDPPHLRCPGMAPTTPTCYRLPPVRLLDSLHSPQLTAAPALLDQGARPLQHGAL